MQHSGLCDWPLTGWYWGIEGDPRYYNDPELISYT